MIFKVKCMETALGYSNITPDLYSVTYPEGDDDSWEKMSKKIAKANLGTYWKAYEAFDATTLDTESDAHPQISGTLTISSSARAM